MLIRMNSLQGVAQELDRALALRREERNTWMEFDKKLSANDKGAQGTAIPALYSTFYKFVQNPSTVSVDTYKRMIDTDDTIGSGVDFLTTALASRLGRYQHKSPEITEWVNQRMEDMEGGWYAFVKEMLSAVWAGFYTGEQVWENTEHGYVIQRTIGMPQTSILFEVDQEGRVLPDGIMQYQRNVNPFGGSANSFWGSNVAGGFVLGGGNEFRTDPLARFGDMVYPVRNANSFMYMVVRIPKEKCIHYAFDSQGKMGNPYGRSILRRAFNAYISKAQTMQMMLRALDRKGTPLMVVYSAPNATVKDPNKTRSSTGNVRGQDVGVDAAKSVSQAFSSVHNDTVITLPGKKGQIYDVDVIPMDSNAEAFIAALQYFDRCEMRAMLLPSLVFTGGDGGGAYALGQEHAKTFDKICDGNLYGLRDVLKRQYVERLLMYNFPRSAWEKDGVGDFSKRELTQDEREKEAEHISKAVDIGVCDLSDIGDFNTVREKFGLEPKDVVPDSVAQAQVQAEFDENGDVVDGDGQDELQDGDEPQGKQEKVPAAGKGKKFARVRPRLRKQAGLGKLALGSKGKLCSMFLFADVALPEVLHVTHKYFGKGTDEEFVERVRGYLQAYFEDHPFEAFTPTFDRVEMFGDEDHVKVLTGPARERKLFLQDLKKQLDDIQPDKYGDYLPHVSVSDNVDELKQPISDYILINDGKIIFRASERVGEEK